MRYLCSVHASDLSLDFAQHASTHRGINGAEGLGAKVAWVPRPLTEVARHVHVQALRCARVVRRPPVAHHEAAKAHGILEVGAEELAARARVGPVHEVVAAHGGGAPGLASRLVGGIVDLEERPGVGDVRGVGVSVSFLVVQAKVFHHRHDALVLEPLHVGRGEGRAQEWVLSRHVLRVAPAPRHPVQVEPRAEDNVGALSLELVGRGGGPLLH